jgi:Tol biopolymer transport system component
LIAFVSTRDGNGEIYVMNADGSDQRRMTNWRLWDGFPDWSPDASQIVYYSYLSEESWVIKAMGAGGSNPRQLTAGGTCEGAPHWSPDSTRITYDSGDCSGDHREIHVMNADGSNLRNLSNNEADDMLAAWSPDSAQLVFSSNRDGNYELYVMDDDGGNVRRLTENTADDHAPAWSPDGTQIAFYSERDGNAEVYVMDADGGTPRNLTNNPTEDWFPRWSPDGSQITFSSKRGGNLDIYVMNADGSHVRRLTDSPREDFNSVWQPRPTTAQADTWVRTYAGDPVWAALDGLQTNDGGYLLVGSSNYSHQNTPREDIYLVRMDAAGDILWEKGYGSDDFDRGNAAIQADDGGFVILGETQSSGAGDWDMLLLRVDADGNELWSRTFGGPAKERGNTIQGTSDGGYILAGSTESFGAGASDLFLVRTDDLGNEVWSKTYGGESEEEANDAHVTEDGGLLILAQVLQSARLYTDQDPDVYLLRTDGAGNEIWSQVWENENVEGGHALLPTSDGNYIMVGITSSAGSESDIDFLFLKIDSDGNLLWDSSISDAGPVDYGIDVVQTLDGGYLITGMFNDGGRGAIPLIKTDSSGQILWARNLIAGPGNKAGMRVLPAPDGGFVIIGNTDEYHRGFETVLIRTDSQGNVTKGDQYEEE